MRRAFTLVEVLVALILFQIGMLALAGTTAVAARDLASAHRNTMAQRLARNRLELLRARACATAGTGSAALVDGFTESWRIEEGPSLRRISVTVEFALTRGRLGRVALRGSTLCQP